MTGAESSVHVSVRQCILAPSNGLHTVESWLLEVPGRPSKAYPMRKGNGVSTCYLYLIDELFLRGQNW